MKDNQYNQQNDIPLHQEERGKALMGSIIGGLFLIMCGSAFLLLLIGFFAGWEFLSWLIAIPILCLIGMGILGWIIEVYDKMMAKLKK
jgi:hypothetical protein